jgi:hypothetical protein
VSVHHASATKLPFKANTFDLILNRHMLHCVPMVRISEVSDESFRVLKAGGIVHFVAEDMEMIYSSTSDEERFREEKKLRSSAVCDIGRELGVDLRIGRKLPAILPLHGFFVQSIKFALIDSHHIHRRVLVNIFELWRKTYAEVWKQNNVNYRYDKDFQNFIELVQDDFEYVCWGLPIIQAINGIRQVTRVATTRLTLD